MYRLTEFKAPYVHYKCECGRQFIEEEMYLCVKCTKGVCRFCLEEEIEYFYCKFCNDVLSVAEA
jgi:dynactin-4